MTRTGLSFSFWMAPTSPITFSREATGGGPAVVQPLMWYRTTSSGGLLSCIVCIRDAVITFQIIPIGSGDVGRCMVYTCLIWHSNLRTVKDIQKNLVIVLHRNSVIVVDFDNFAVKCSHPLIWPEKVACFLSNSK